MIKCTFTFTYLVAVVLVHALLGETVSSFTSLFVVVASTVPQENEG